MSTILPVPHVPQYGTGANRYTNDCGAAAGCSLLRAYRNDYITVDQLYSESGATVAGMHFLWHTKPVLERHGLQTIWRMRVSEEEQRGWIFERRPYISVVWNGRMWHSIVVVGSNIPYVYIQDPLLSYGPRQSYWSQLIAMQGSYRAILVPVARLPM